MLLEVNTRTPKFKLWRNISYGLSVLSFLIENGIRLFGNPEDLHYNILIYSLIFFTVFFAALVFYFDNRIEIDEKSLKDQNQELMELLAIKTSLYEKIDLPSYIDTEPLFISFTDSIYETLNKFEKHLKNIIGENEIRINAFLHHKELDCFILINRYSSIQDYNDSNGIKIYQKDKGVLGLSWLNVRIPYYDNFDNYGTQSFFDKQKNKYFMTKTELKGKKMPSVEYLAYKTFNSNKVQPIGLILIESTKVLHMKNKEKEINNLYNKLELEFVTKLEMLYNSTYFKYNIKGDCDE